MNYLKNMDTKKMKQRDKKENVKKIEEKYLKLIKEINIHNKLYYDKNNPKISDAEYDALWKNIKDLEVNFPFLKKGLSYRVFLNYNFSNFKLESDFFPPFLSKI